MNKSKAIGTRAETNVCRFLQKHGINAERRALAGNKDLGDIKISTSTMHTDMIIEVKAGKQTWNPSRTQLAEWLRQTETEGKNSKTRCALCVVRYKRHLEDADVYFPYMGMRCHMYLDEFAQWIVETTT